MFNPVEPHVLLLRSWCISLSWITVSARTPINLRLRYLCAAPQTTQSRSRVSFTRVLAVESVWCAEPRTRTTKRHVLSSRHRWSAPSFAKLFMELARQMFNYYNLWTTIYNTTLLHHSNLTSRRLPPCQWSSHSSPSIPTKREGERAFNAKVPWQARYPLWRC